MYLDRPPSDDDDQTFGPPAKPHVEGAPLPEPPKGKRQLGTADVVLFTLLCLIGIFALRRMHFLGPTLFLTFAVVVLIVAVIVYFKAVVWSRTQDPYDLAYQDRRGAKYEVAGGIIGGFFNFILSIVGFFLRGGRDE